MISTLIAALLALQAAALEGDYLYRTLLIRAAPGELLETIDLYTERTTMGSFTEYYSIERVARRQEAADASGTTEAEFVSAVDERTAWREEVYVLGPAPDVVAEAFRSNAYYHVEMFIALPGKREALIEERRMENAYLAGIDRPQNLIFRRVAGAAWDSYTIGFYKDIKHYAASADIPSDRKEASAKAAGFEGADYIGSFLRTLIDWHHDTLCVSVGR